MGIQYWPGMRQSENSQKLAITSLEQTLDTDVMIIPMNEYIQSGMSPLEIFKKVKCDCESGIDKGFNNIVAYSSGASLFMIAAKDIKVNSAILLAPTLTPLNLEQRKKNKKNSKDKTIPKLSNKFTLYDAVLIFGYAFLANFNKDHLKETPTLIIQGNEDEMNRPKGAIKLHSRLLDIAVKKDDIHFLEIVQGTHNLLVGDNSKEKTLELINKFYSKYHK